MLHVFVNLMLQGIPLHVLQHQHNDDIVQLPCEGSEPYKTPQYPSFCPRLFISASSVIRVKRNIMIQTM